MRWIILLIAILLASPGQAQSGRCGFFTDQHCWTTATRPSPPVAGTMGFNQDLNSPEYYDGVSWINLDPIPWQANPVTGSQYGLAIATSPANTTLTVPGDAKCANIQALQTNSANIRFTTDGTAATSSVGMQLFPGQTIQYCGTYPTAMKFTGESAGQFVNVDYAK